MPTNVPGAAKHQQTSHSNDKGMSLNGAATKQSPSSKRTHARHGTHTTTKGSGAALTPAAAGAVDELRDATIGLLTRHLDQPLLKQPTPSHLSVPRAAAGPSGTDGHPMEDAAAAAAKQAEAAATATFFRGLSTDARKSYEDAAIAEYTRQREESENRQRARQRSPHSQYHHHAGKTESLLDNVYTTDSDSSGQDHSASSPAHYGSSGTDDRITAQTLHLLLGKSRVAVERVLPPALSALHNRYYTFDTGAKRAEREAEMQNPLGTQSTKLANSLRHMQAAIKHQEPPIARLSSESARYYYPATSSDAQTELMNTDPTTMAASFAARRPTTPETALLHYPPVPVQYANADARKQAMARKRLGLTSSVPPSEAAVHRGNGACTAGTPSGHKSLKPLSKRNLRAKDVEALLHSVSGSAQQQQRAAREQAGQQTRLPDIRGDMRATDHSTLPTAAHDMPDDAAMTAKQRYAQRQMEWAERHDGARDFDQVDMPISRTGHEQVSLQFALTAAATRGDDGALIHQLVKLYGRQVNQATVGSEPQTAPPYNTSLKSTTIKGSVSRASAAAAAPAPSPMLEAILSVSREYDQVRVRAAHENSVGASVKDTHDASAHTARTFSSTWLSAGDAAQDRQEIVSRLTSLTSTRIPEQYWVTVQQKSLPSCRPSVAVTAASSKGLVDTADGLANGTRRSVSKAASTLTQHRLHQHDFVTAVVTSARNEACNAEEEGEEAYRDAPLRQADHKATTLATFLTPTAATHEGNREGSSSISTRQVREEEAASVLQPESRGEDSERQETTATSVTRAFATDVDVASDVNGSGTGTLRDSVACASRVPRVDVCVSVRESDREGGTTKEGLVVFPAPRPTGRAQVYLLAETLDHMLHADPSWMRAVADRETAYTILPRSASPEADAISLDQEAPSHMDGAASAARDVEHANPLMDPEVQWRSSQAYEVYTRAAGHVLTVLDTGLVELVRQVSVQCVERGALLDVIRQTLVDLAESHVRVLAYTKERAFEEATARVAIREELTDMHQRLAEAHETIRTLRETQNQADVERAQLEEKAARLDELVARVEAKRQRYEIHSEDAHAFVLKELEKQMKHTASEALNSLFEERCRLAGLTVDEDGSDDARSVQSHAPHEFNERATRSARQRQKRASDALRAESTASAAGTAMAHNGIGGFSVSALQAEIEKQNRSAAHRQKKIDRKAASAAHATSSLRSPSLSGSSIVSDDDDASSMSSTTAAMRAGIAEAPTAEEARKLVSDRRKAAGTLYHEAHQLLRTLHEATEAMNAASAPVYDKVVLRTVSPAARVATSRWAAIARAIGAFEKERSHRQRVFAVFCDWCARYQEMHRKERKATAQGRPAQTAEEEEVDAVEGNTENVSQASRRFSRLLLARQDDDDAARGGGGFLVDSSGDDEDGYALGSGGRHRRAESLCDESAASFMSLPSAGQSIRDVSAHTVAEVKKEATEAEKLVENTRSLREIKYITQGDLLDMGVRDCTAEEVNLLFTNGFDFRKYLHPVWKPRLHSPTHNGDDEVAAVSPTQANRAAAAAADFPAGDTGEWTLTLSDVAEMVRDVQATLREMTLRMRAMSESAIMQRGVQPPMQPPQHPEDPCPLCARCDTQGEERKRRQEALRQVAKDVQKRLEDLTEKCQRAEAEREDARSDVRRLQAELQALKQHQAKHDRPAREHLSKTSQRDDRDGGDGASSPYSSPIPGGGGGSPHHSARSPHESAPRGIIKRRTVDDAVGVSPSRSFSRASPKAGQRKKKTAMVATPTHPSGRAGVMEDAVGERETNVSVTLGPRRRSATQVRVFGGEEDDKPPSTSAAEETPTEGVNSASDLSFNRRGTLPPSALSTSGPLVGNAPDTPSSQS